MHTNKFHSRDSSRRIQMENEHSSKTKKNIDNINGYPELKSRSVASQLVSHG